MAIHNRIGAGGKECHARGSFVPRTDDENIASIMQCPCWTLLARSLGPTIEIILVPGTRYSELDSVTEFFLRAQLVLPDDSEVTSLVFYGDDGISSLSPHLDKEEGSQSLGFVMKCRDSLSGETTEELCVLSYDNLLFQRNLFKRGKSEITIPADNNCVALTGWKARHISTYESNSQMYRQRDRLRMCGSRGTGGVITFDAAQTSLKIFDLEEDEEHSVSSSA